MPINTRAVKRWEILYSEVYIFPSHLEEAWQQHQRSLHLAVTRATKDVLRFFSTMLLKQTNELYLYSNSIGLWLVIYWIFGVRIRNKEVVLHTLLSFIGYDRDIIAFRICLHSAFSGIFRTSCHFTINELVFLKMMYFCYVLANLFHRLFFPVFLKFSDLECLTDPSLHFIAVRCSFGSIHLSSSDRDKNKL